MVDEILNEIDILIAVVGVIEVVVAVVPRLPLWPVFELAALVVVALDLDGAASAYIARV